jgi:hypothetical protein
MDKLKRRAALIQAYVKALDAFLCQYAKLPLEMVDRSSPYWIQFDHIVPVKTSAFQALWAVFNQMKGDLADDEFRQLSIMLRDHWIGTRFDKDAVKFQYWNRTKLQLALGPIEDLPLGESPTENCVVCGDRSYPKSVYCPRCRQFMRADRESLERRKALQTAWNPIKRKFICYYTGVELDHDDLNKPWYVSFDHKIPRTKGDLVVAALWISIMKADLARDEFYAVVNDLAKCFESRKAFDKGVCEFKYWTIREGGTRKLRRLLLV